MSCNGFMQSVSMVVVTQYLFQRTSIWTVVIGGSWMKGQAAQVRLPRLQLDLSRPVIRANGRLQSFQTKCSTDIALRSMPYNGNMNAKYRVPIHVGDSSTLAGIDAPKSSRAARDAGTEASESVMNITKQTLTRFPRSTGMADASSTRKDAI